MEDKNSSKTKKIGVKSITILVGLGIIILSLIIGVCIENSQTKVQHATATSSKVKHSKKQSVHSIKVDPIEIYNTPSGQIMPQDDGTIIIEGKTAPNKKLRLNAKGFIDNETGDITSDVSGLTVSDKDGHFKLNFNEHDQSASDLINLMYILDNKDSIEVCVGDDNFRGSKYLTIITIDAEITLE